MKTWGNEGIAPYILLPTGLGPLLGIEPRLLGHPAHRLVTVLT